MNLATHKKNIYTIFFAYQSTGQWHNQHIKKKIHVDIHMSGASPRIQQLKNLPASAGDTEDTVQSLGWEAPL